LRARVPSLGPRGQPAFARSRMAGRCARSVGARHGHRPAGLRSKADRCCRPDARLWLQAYVWPDQAGRLAALRGAMEIALAMGIRVEGASATAWLAREVAEQHVGRTTVIYHSVVMQYFSETERAAFLHALEQAC